MPNYELSAQKRDALGTSQVRKLRWDNQIPGVIYGSGKEALSVQVGTRDLEKALAATGSLIDLQLEDEKRTVIVKDVQHHPVRGDIIHVDFHEVALDKKLEITVPIRVINEDQRPSDGGVVGTLLWEITVSCLPTDIPEAITVDVSQLELGSTLTIADLDVPEGIEVLGDPDEAVVKVDVPQAETEETDEEEAELPEDGEGAAEPATEEEE